MSSRHLRHDNVCQNCGDQVEKRFCGNCGQENSETRQSFAHLFRHFIEDLTHYDSAFWLTMKYLLLKPAFLTKEYLSGKRIRFVPPVRLYIFISFITFFLPYVLPDMDPDAESERYASVVHRDSTVKTKQIGSAEFTFGDEGLEIELPQLYPSVKAMDSVEASLPPHKRLGMIDRWFVKKNIHLGHYPARELGDRFMDSFGHNFPKALFIYLPIFALLLWLFHGKKRWLYFDHAIFTLHYFSFILLVFNILTISEEFIFLGEAFESFQLFLLLGIVIAIFVYFFVAHKRMYGESGTVSFLKSSTIYLVNLTLFAGLLVGLGIISFLSIH